ncbi:MAG: DUF5711 family protein [Clostridia bacterium]|nr:DUF5711 family protein [Clostridia bacterium]
MAEYKRKKVKHSKRRTAPKINKRDIKRERKISEKQESPAEDNEAQVRVIRGNKPKRTARAKFFGGVVVVLAVVVAILHFALPIGIVEVFGNRISAMGVGGYPSEIYGTEVLNVANKGYYYYTLTDSELVAYSTAGKKIFSEAHGFGAPVLTCSETRALIYDSYGYHLSIYNLRHKVTSKSFDDPIQTAAIGRNGSYAVVTGADGYASVVTIFDVNGKQIYQWFSAKDIVNNVVLARNGKQIAVSTLNTESGAMHSKVSVLKFDSANAVQSYDYGDRPVLSLENYASGFVILSENTCSHVQWKNYDKSDYSSNASLYKSRISTDGMLLVYNRSGDRQDNHIVLFSNRGKKEGEFDFNHVITDMVYENGNVYCISDTVVYLLKTSGEVVCQKSCKYGAERLAVLSRDSLAIITSGEISRVVLND